MRSELKITIDGHGTFATKNIVELATVERWKRADIVTIINECYGGPGFCAGYWTRAELASLPKSALALLLVGITHPSN